MPTHITIQTTDTNTTDNPLDVWQVDAVIPDDDSSFGASASTEEEDDEVVWSVSLPVDTALARRTMEARLHTLATRQRAVVRAGQALRNLEDPAEEAGAFDLGEAPDLSQDEAALLQTLYHLRGDDEAVSFALGWLERLGKPAVEWDSIVGEYQAFMGQVLYLLRPTLRVETRIEQRLLAHTIVRAGGNVQTAWHRSVGPDEMRLHQQTTQLTLETRQALTLFLAQISAGAASLAVRFSIPGGNVVALPAAFRFARDVVRRVRSDRLLERLAELREGPRHG